MNNKENEMKNLIMEHIDSDECGYMCDDKLFDCISCSCFKTCYATAEFRCDDELDNIIAEAINYGGYDSAEEFWEQIYD